MELFLAIIMLSAFFGFWATVIIYVLIAKAKKSNVDEDEVWRGVQDNLKP